VEDVPATAVKRVEATKEKTRLRRRKEQLLFQRSFFGVPPSSRKIEGIDQYRMKNFHTMIGRKTPSSSRI
jgi:hypothetical protein